MPRKKKNNYTLQQGSSIYYDNEHFIVLQILDLNYILAENFNSHEVKKLKIIELKTTPDNAQTLKSSLIEVLPDEDWQTAQQRFEIIQPLLHKSDRTAEEVTTVANLHNLHMTTIYKWLRLYETDGLLTGLSPRIRSDAGKTKLTETTELIIQTCIEEEYLTSQRKSITSLYNTIQIQCRNAQLPIPHVNTVRNRVKKLSGKLKINRRFGSKKANELFDTSQGEFPHADHPLAVIQIDHTPVDIILVDDEHRMPTERPWITLAIDVYSRMVVGLYVSFETPSATSVGVCIANSILPKDNWLAEHDIAASWPCWGIPRTVHADNAKEFRGSMLQRASQEYGFSIEWRPVARPHFGGHIERLLGTFAKEIHNLPGTTFSNTKQREGYDSDKQSALTLREFEKWLGILITESYHQKFHTGIQCSPIKKYEEGILGTKTTKGTGLPRRIQDEETLRLNFLPYEERTVQAYGISIDGIHYFHDILRVWVNAKSENNKKLKRKFICRRDPRNISIIWFFDPQVKTYFPIPYRNTRFPAISIWELKAAQKQLKETGLKDVNEDLIFNAIEKMRVIEEKSIKTTKKARRDHQRRKVANKKSITVNHSKQKDSLTEAPFDDDDIQPFDELLEVKNNV